MAPAGSRLLILALVYVTISSVRGQENDDTYSCSESENIERAEVGKGLTLECDGRPFITITCPAFQWFRVRENTNDSLSGNTSSYTVSQNVPAVEDVGGHLYGCQCPQAGSAGNTPCKLFRIWVVPDVTLTFSNTMVKVGTSVNVTCTAQSYPPANLTSYYQLQHPSGVTVNAIYRTPEVDGVVHPIETVTSEDGGEYDCIVTVVVGSEQLQSDTIRASLTVYYDPPYIKRVRNFTISLEPSVEQSAFVFECEVQIPEPDLEVWVDWIPADGKSIKTNATQRVGNVFFLAVFNVTKEDDDQLYVCQLFSAHSPDKSVDKRTASAQRATSTSAPGELTPLAGDCDCLLAWMVGVFVTFLVTGGITCVITASITAFYFHKRQQKQISGHVATDGETQVQVTPNNYVDFPSPVVTEKPLESQSEDSKLPASGVNGNRNGENLTGLESATKNTKTTPISSPRSQSEPKEEQQVTFRQRTRSLTQEGRGRRRSSYMKMSSIPTEEDQD